MKIAYILADPGIGIFGTKGASVHAQEMIRAFQHLGHQVTVYCIKRGNTAADPSSESVPEDLRRLPVFELPVSGAKGAAAREQAVRKVASRMALLAADQRYDLVYERYSLFSDAGAQISRAISAPLVLEVNAPLLSEQALHRSLHDAEGAQRATLTSFAAAKVLSCVSTAVADWVRGLMAQDEAAGTPRVIITPNGVDTERFTPGRQRTTGPFTIGFSGTLKPWHGTELLLEAYAAAPAAQRRSWSCEILGDGPQRKHLEETAAALKITDNVRFHGALAPAQVPAVLRGWDVAVAPYPEPQAAESHYFSPLKIYEYLAAGLPTVASAVGELPQLIDHDVTGVLVPGSDVSALSGALVELSADPRRRRRLGAAARQEAAAHHSWQRRAVGVLTAAQLPRPIPVREVLA